MQIIYPSSCLPSIVPAQKSVIQPAMCLIFGRHSQRKILPGAFCDLIIGSARIGAKDRQNLAHAQKFSRRQNHWIL